MCLTQITKTFKDDQPQKRVGYKVVKHCGTTWLSLVFHNIYHRKFDSWLTRDCLGYIELPHTKEYYPSGFHLYKTIDHARQSGFIGTIVKVYYRHKVAEGTQNNIPVIVAREIFVLQKPIESQREMLK